MPGLCGCFRFAKIGKIFDMGMLSSGFNILNVQRQVIVSVLCLSLCFVVWRAEGWLCGGAGCPYSLFACSICRSSGMPRKGSVQYYLRIFVQRGQN